MSLRVRARTGKSHGKAESKPQFSKLLSGEFKRGRDSPLPFVPKAETNAESGEVFRALRTLHRQMSLFRRTNQHQDIGSVRDAAASQWFFASPSIFLKIEAIFGSAPKKS